MLLFSISFLLGWGSPSASNLTLKLIKIFLKTCLDFLCNFVKLPKLCQMLYPALFEFVLVSVLVRVFSPVARGGTTRERQSIREGETERTNEGYVCPLIPPNMWDLHLSLPGLVLMLLLPLAGAQISTAASGAGCNPDRGFYNCSSSGSSPRCISPEQVRGLKKDLRRIG